jgi:hypothetical protein
VVTTPLPTAATATAPPRPPGTTSAAALGPPTANTANATTTVGSPETIGASSTTTTVPSSTTTNPPSGVSSTVRALGDVDLSNNGQSGGGLSAFTVLAVVLILGLAFAGVVVARRRRGTPS